MAVPTETKEQQGFMQKCKRATAEYPELALIFAIPNGGKRHIATASRMKLEGVKPGVPDLFFPVARKGYHGLFIEMKRIKGGSLSKDQKQWKIDLRDQGYCWFEAKGGDAAWAFIMKYLS